MGSFGVGGARRSPLGCGELLPSLDGSRWNTLPRHRPNGADRPSTDARERQGVWG